MERRAWHLEATPAGDARTTWGSWITAQGPPATPPHTALTQAPRGTLGTQTTDPSPLPWRPAEYPRLEKGSSPRESWWASDARLPLP